MAQHHLVHAGARPYKCLECGAAFRRVSSLLEHQKIHTGEKPFRCGGCGKAFSFSALIRHQKMHANKTPHERGPCGNTSARLPHLTRPLSSHGEEKPVSSRGPAETSGDQQRKS